jgi:uncharacterized membrane protein YeaQ/YmgE (transglycosylase-associated protein family)
MKIAQAGGRVSTRDLPLPYGHPTPDSRAKAPGIQAKNGLTCRTAPDSGPVTSYSKSGQRLIGPKETRQYSDGKLAEGGQNIGKARFLAEDLLPEARRGQKENDMLNFLMWIIVGGIIGWVASMVMRTDAQQGTLLNIVVGIVGAFLAGLVLTPLFGVDTINSGNFSLPALLISLLGAIILLAIVNLFRRGTVR